MAKNECNCITFSFTKVFNNTTTGADNEADGLLSEGSFLPTIAEKPRQPENTISRLPNFISTHHHSLVVEKSSDLQDHPEQVSCFKQPPNENLVPQIPERSRTVPPNKNLVPQIPERSRTVRRRKAQATLLDKKPPASPHVHFTPSTIFRSDLKETKKREITEKEDCEKVSQNESILANSDIQPRYFSHKKIVLKLREHVSNLFGSFYLINLHLPTDPVPVVSRDLLLEDALARNEVTFLRSHDTDCPWILSHTPTTNGLACSLTVHGDLFERNCGNGKATHRFVSQLDLTNLLADIKSCITQITSEPIEDVWLQLAYQYLAREGSCSSYPRKTFNINDTISADVLEDAIIDSIRLLHQQYFIVGPSRGLRDKYAINHLAPGLKNPSALEHQNPHSSAFLDLEGLAGLFDKGDKFFAKIKWKPSGLYQWLYCLPMHDPKTPFWLCFMIDGRLPNIWAIA